MATVKIKRVYQPAAAGDGFRVLVDGLWPRGISKEKAHANLWPKEVAPSSALRKWFNHEDNKWLDFSKKYEQELLQNAAFDLMKKIINTHKTVTLLYGAKTKHTTRLLYCNAC